MAALSRLTEKDSPHFVTPADYLRVVLSISPDVVDVRERGNGLRILYTAVRDVSQVTLGPRKGNLR